MVPVIEVRYVSGHTIWLRFADGLQGEIDLSGELWGPMFEPLKDPELFRAVRVNPELRTIVWPNGADFAPEFLYTQIRVPA
jgi:hypothetical protein